MIRNADDTTTEPETWRSLLSARPFDALVEGYYEADPDGRLTAANSSLCQMLGISDPAQIVGMMPSRFVDAETWARIEQTRDHVLTSREPALAVACSITRADGETRALEFSIAPMGSEMPTGFCGIVRDVTARAAAAAESARLFASLEAQLAEMRVLYTQVSELEQLKTHMIRVAAHDLRSPLSIITSYIELLHEDLAAHYNDMDEMYVNAIRQAIARMMQMTSDILSLERLHEQREVTPTRVQLGGLLELTMLEFIEETHKRQQSAELRIEPLIVMGDSMELHEAVANLIGNAIKYTPGGGTIRALLRREGDFALLEIVDNGFGIPSDQQAELFQPFRRIKTRETYAIDGTGLGLYLVKRIVERHGGSVHFQSEHGKGSLFGFRLPLAQAETS